jgi:hypothetical protein
MKGSIGIGRFDAAVFTLPTTWSTTERREMRGETGSVVFVEA